MFPCRFCRPLYVLLLTALLAGCSAAPRPTPATKSTKTQAADPARLKPFASAPSSPTREGKELFARNCAACHKVDRMQGRRAARIRSAARQFPIMYHTRSLRDDELQQIASFLGAAKPPATVKTTPNKTSPAPPKPHLSAPAPPLATSGKTPKTANR